MRPVEIDKSLELSLEFQPRLPEGLVQGEIISSDEITTVELTS